MPPWAWIALGGDLASALGGGRCRKRRGLREPVGIGVGRPGRVVDGRAHALGVQQHLRATVRDRLEGADGDAELLTVLDVFERHLERALAEPEHLGGEHDADPAYLPDSAAARTLENGERVCSSSWATRLISF